jgi:hypothetical protein
MRPAPCDISSCMPPSEIKVYVLCDSHFAETGCKKPFGNGRTYCHCMSLAQRTGGVLYPPFDIHFRVTRRGASPLPEILKLLKLKCPVRQSME